MKKKLLTKVQKSLKKLLMMLFAGLIIQSFSYLNAQTGMDLWNAYIANPENHPNIPNCSYAGYRTGNVPLPNPSLAVYNVKNAPYNAAGNGITDDAPAIQAAINAAGIAGGGIVHIPAGTFLLNNFLHIKYSNIVLRGEGRDITTLDFAKSLQTLKGDLITNTTDYWWWAGGLIWIGPGDTFDGSGKVDVSTNSQIQGWEYWRGGSVITTVSGNPTRGTKSITVADASGLSAGMKVLMTWENPTDKSLLKHIYGHAATEGGFDTDNGGVGDCSWIIPPSYPRFQWAVEIAFVSGNAVTLVQPLRIDVQANWNVRFEQSGSVITESGVENLRIKGHAQPSHNHLTKPTSLVGGWNGVYINRSWNCWTNNIAVTSMENGVILAAAKNVTVQSVLIDGTEQNHHSFACRVNSHDNLFENFTVNGPRRVRHGINTEWLSSGNVWSKGLQKAGTFDSHRALSFDLIRTECTVANDGGSVPGGGGAAGPFIGRRAAIWNVLEYIDPNYGLSTPDSRGGDDIHEPKQYVMGVMVGVRGQPLNTTEGESMPLGDKGTIVADDGIIPSILNLYEVEKSFRAKQSALVAPTVNITSPANNTTFASGSNITINVNAADSDGSIRKVEFYSGTLKVGEDLTSPYNFVWTGVIGGSYSLTAKAVDNSTMVTTSSAVNITVGDPSSYRNPENPANAVNGLNYSYYEGSWTALPDFSTLTAIKSGNSYNFYTSLKNRDNQFGLKFTGYITIPTDGEYTFYTTSDDGSKLYIGTNVVVNNDGQHSQQERSGTIGLKAGKHAITVAYFEQNSGGILNVSYSGPNLTKTKIPATAIYRVSADPSDINLAFNRPVTVSNTEKPQNAAWNAVDGNPNTRWATLFSDPQWIYVDLGAVYNISRVKLNWEVFGKDFKIQVTNNPNGTWTDLKTVVGNTATVNDLTGLSGSGRYVRMYGTARGTSYGYSLWEYEVYGISNAPSVTITNPANNTTFTAGANISITANATDTDGTVSKVEFFQNDNKVGEDTSSPYSFSWNNVSAGTYSLTAKASDNNNNVTTSSAVSITINPTNVLVTGVTVSPTSGTLTISATQQLMATVTPANATTKTVSWSSSNTAVATVNASGFVTAVAAGSATVTVTTTDQGKTATSAITVTGAGAGSVVYAVNAGGASFTATDGTVYEADKYFIGGSTYTTSTSAIANTTDDVLYTSERYGNMAYEFPVTNGNYTVTLKFAEIYQSSAGRRQFDVAMEGVTVINNLDIFAVVGANYTAYDVVNDVTVSDGKLNIVFNTDIDNASISAILIKNAALKNATLKSAPVATEKVFQFKAYPNPASGFITLESDYTGDTQVVFTDITGKVVIASKYSGTFKEVISISKLSPGIYLIKTISGKDVDVRKILVK